MDVKLVKLSDALGVELGLLPEAEAKRKAELGDNPGMAAAVAALRAAMGDGARAIEAAAIAEDTAAVAAAEQALAAEAQAAAAAPEAAP